MAAASTPTRRNHVGTSKSRCAGSVGGPSPSWRIRACLASGRWLAHCVWLEDDEIRRLADTGTSVVHCPCSNMKLASGAARVGPLREAGVIVGLGTDGEKENNNLSLFEEMKFASLLQKLSTLDATAGDPWDVLQMATLDGARALGLDQRVRLARADCARRGQHQARPEEELKRSATARRDQFT